MNRALHTLWVTMAFVATMASCGVESPTQSYLSDVDPLMWRQVAPIAINNRDTTSMRDIAIVVRHQPHERLDSITLRITTQSPDSTRFTEKITIRLGAKRRRRLGATITEIVPYRENVVFGQRGIYNIGIYPTPPLKGVEAIGVEIESN